LKMAYLTGSSEFGDFTIRCTAKPSVLSKESAYNFARQRFE